MSHLKVRSPLSEDNYNGMKTAIEGLGIAELPNTNYLKAAKCVVGLD